MQKVFRRINRLGYAAPPRRLRSKSEVPEGVKAKVVGRRVLTKYEIKLLGLYGLL